jgi:hypothetical protein
LQTAQDAQEEVHTTMTITTTAAAKPGQQARSMMARRAQGITLQPACLPACLPACRLPPGTTTAFVRHYCQRVLLPMHHP